MAKFAEENMQTLARSLLQNGAERASPVNPTSWVTLFPPPPPAAPLGAISERKLLFLRPLRPLRLKNAAAGCPGGVESR